MHVVRLVSTQPGTLGFAEGRNFGQIMIFHWGVSYLCVSSVLRFSSDLIASLPSSYLSPITQAEMHRQKESDGRDGEKGSKISRKRKWAKTNLPREMRRSKTSKSRGVEEMELCTHNSHPPLGHPLI